MALYANSPARLNMCAGFLPKYDNNCCRRFMLRRIWRREKCVKNASLLVRIEYALLCDQFS